MKKSTTIMICVVVSLLLMNAMPAMGAITMTFEEFVGNDQAPISTYYTGVSFQSGSGGSDWVARDATSNNYNISSWPTKQQWLGGNFWIYDYVGATTALNYTGNDGVIAFDNENATFVELGYCSGSTLQLLAYNSGGGLIDSDSGPANRRYIEGNESGPGTLRVDAPSGYISYVVVKDTGNFWIVDDITTDATGISVIPAPGACILGGIGVGLVGWLRRRRNPLIS